jgi:hypothetical protein
MTTLYVSAPGHELPLCQPCERRLAGRWPRDEHGRAYAASRGRSDAPCAWCTREGWLASALVVEWEGRG